MNSEKPLSMTHFQLLCVSNLESRLIPTLFAPQWMCDVEARGACSLLQVTEDSEAGTLPRRLWATSWLPPLLHGPQMSG